MNRTYTINYHDANHDERVNRCYGNSSTFIKSSPNIIAAIKACYKKLGKVKIYSISSEYPHHELGYTATQFLLEMEGFIK
jgi:hypothetical protein